MGALGDGVDPDLDHRIRLCNLLGIDAEETTSVTVRIEAGVGAVVEWRGIRRVPLSRLVLALADVVDDEDPAPGPPVPQWPLPADPWAVQPLARLCDVRGEAGCCGTPACLNAGKWTGEPPC